MNTKNFKRVNPFNYFGGKTRYLDFILPLIPHGTYTHYREEFCGSASVFFNKKKDPIETINDIDGRLINFFQVLRSQPEKLVEQLLLTPYSRSEFQLALGEDTDVVEQARRYFVRTMMAFGSAGSTKRRVNSFRIGLTETRNGRAMEVDKYFKKIERLPELVDALRDAQIENRDFVYTMTNCDGKHVFRFLDPPYLHEGRTGTTDYTYEMNVKQHEQLAGMCNESESKIMLCGYMSPFMKKHYSSDRWDVIQGPTRKSNLGKRAVTEYVWINYEVDRQAKLWHDEESAVRIEPVKS